MAYETFIPTVEHARFLKEAESNLILVKHCSREYEGDVKEKGDQVKILVAGKVTISNSDKNTLQRTGLGTSEDIENGELFLQINQYRSYNYGIGDIDQQQSDKKGLVGKYRASASRGMAEEFEKYVASVIVADSTKYTDTAVGSKDAANKVNATALADELLVELKNNNIGNEKVVLEASPKFIAKLRDDYEKLDTDNSDMLANGYIGKFHGMYIAESTNMSNIEGDEYVFLRTEDAVAFVNPFGEVKPYGKDSAIFRDNICGYELFDAKVIYPNKVIACKVTY